MEGDRCMKTCTKCRLEKELDAFYVKESGRDGRTAQCIECIKATTYNYKKNNPEKHREATRKYNYAKHGITIEKWESLLSEQNGCCASCGKENTNERNLHIDHDHSCCPGTYSCGNCIRGLLCSQCNTALGLLEDKVDRVMNLAAYLVSHENVLTGRR